MLELLGELLMLILGEAVFDVVMHWGLESSRATRLFLLILLFAFLGALLGGLTLLVFPAHLIRGDDLRLASLVVTPVVTAAIFALIGRRRLRQHKPVSALEEFWPAYSFALAFALVRYFGAA